MIRLWNLLLGRSGSAADAEEIVAEPSPLDYPGYARVQRLSLVDRTAPPAPAGMAYFAPTTRTVMRDPSTGRAYRKPRVISIPFAFPGTVAFIDYSELGDGSIYIHYMLTRRDLARRGYARRLVEALYARFADRPSIDWGDILHPGAEKLWRQMRARSGAPRTYGKV